jgi:hypothetical protein
MFHSLNRFFIAFAFFGIAQSASAKNLVVTDCRRPLKLSSCDDSFEVVPGTKAGFFLVHQNTHNQICRFFMEYGSNSLPYSRGEMRSSQLLFKGSIEELNQIHLVFLSGAGTEGRDAIYFRIPAKSSSCLKKTKPKGEAKPPSSPSQGASIREPVDDAEVAR